MENNKRVLDSPSQNEESAQKKAKINDVPRRGAFKQCRKHSQLFNPANKKGVLMSCMQNREDRAVQEAIDLFGSFADEFYGAFVSPTPSQDDENVETKRFSIYNSGSKGLVFIGIADKTINPVMFVDQIMKSPRLPEFAKKIRFIYRLTPCEVVCGAALSDITEAAKKLIQSHIEPNSNNTENNTPSTFGIVFSKRNNDPIQRDEVIKSVAGLVMTHNPSMKVDLTNPNYCIIVEIFKSACGLCILHNYDKQRRSFNLQQVLEGLKAPQEQGNKNKGNGKEQKDSISNKNEEINQTT